MEKIIEVINLTKDYGFGRGVFDVSFSISKGETFGFLGPNGAGKTTTIRHLMGFSSSQEGKTKILGLDTFNNYAKILKNVGYIPGELSFPAGLTGYEFIKMMQDLVGKKDDNRFKYLCGLFQLDNKQLKGSTKQMSLGTKRKLAIVSAFMSDPDILILDEPTSGLDPFLQDIFIDFLKSEKKRGKTILLSSHIFNEVDQTCDRISIIKEGRIVDTFIANDLKHDKHKNYKIVFDNNKEFSKFLNDNKENELFEITKQNENKNSIHILTSDDSIDKVIELLSTYKIIEFTNKKETLEDYFLKFYMDGKEFGGLNRGK